MNNEIVSKACSCIGLEVQQRKWGMAVILNKGLTLH